MTEYQRLENELRAAEEYRFSKGMSALCYGFCGILTIIPASALLAEGSYKSGSALAFLAFVEAIVCAGNYIKIDDAQANVDKIQREIKYLKQEGLEKRIGG
ncbi:MAG: hypothetical protein PHO02_02630 [Candidatus Nanoarchaeia archaeon]|nr:hypothetical protein [Candidatus Nanoarchaeia archaeon]